MTFLRVPGQRMLHVVGDSVAAAECRRMLDDVVADGWRLHPVADSYTPLDRLQQALRDMTGSARVYNMLRRAGYTTVEEIAATSDEVLRALPTSGENTVAKIRAAVAQWQKTQIPVPAVLAAQAKTALYECATQLVARGGVAAICGFPASGKSTAARYVGAVADATVLDKDAFAPGLEQAVMSRITGDPHDRDSDEYQTVVAPHLYAGLVRTALTVGAKHPIVVDAPFLGLIQDASAAQMLLGEYLVAVAAVDAVVPVTTVWLDTGNDEIRARMRARGADRDADKLAAWDAYETTVLNGGLRESAHRVVDLVIPN
ncbi:AAA family ATPase [Nocardia wallacei]|uniref:AAA family ATPase n=1 Tax=Nocardia wallacei TaxID=480035 RepID=UPI0024552C0D|nr:AAA family ATPase [Nocardia wallacei]